MEAKLEEDLSFKTHLEDGSRTLRNTRRESKSPRSCSAASVRLLESLLIFPGTGFPASSSINSMASFPRVEASCAASPPAPSSPPRLLVAAIKRQRLVEEATGPSAVAALGRWYSPDPNGGSSITGDCRLDRWMLRAPALVLMKA